MPIYSLDGFRPEFPASGRCFVAPDAALIGRVKLEEDASVWFTAVLRGDNEWITVGRGANVQDGCVLHTDPGFPLHIGPGCTIGHRVVLHGCTIGENSLIGMGAVLLNGAKIGKNSIVGAGALITEGKEFPDNSLVVGAPARAIRTLDAKAAEMLRVAAKSYTDRWPQYVKGLKRAD
ncbi:MAG TPA: gamma carbonic anhydrase family protein [Xanthobacteraceae bacterium]|jgi:carbonic anhydrase/acetyltransferase-like protein (isoleucine patch superfamily)